MDIRTSQGRGEPPQLHVAAFDAVFASVPDEDRATYPNGWGKEKLDEFQDAVEQMIAQMTADGRADEGISSEETPLRASSEGRDPASGSPAGESGSPTSPHPQTISPSLTLPPTTPSQEGVEWQPSLGHDSASADPEREIGGSEHRGREQVPQRIPQEPNANK